MESTRMIVSTYLTGASIAKAIAMALGAHMLHIGVWAIADSKSMADTFGVPALPKNVSPDQGSENPWILIHASREIGYGVLILLLAWQGKWHEVGTVVGTIVLSAMMDAYATTKFGPGGLKSGIKLHGVGIFIVGGLSYSLLQIDC